MFKKLSFQKYDDIEKLYGIGETIIWVNLSESPVGEVAYFLLKMCYTNYIGREIIFCDSRNNTVFMSDIPVFGFQVNKTYVLYGILKETRASISLQSPNIIQIE